jgi:hypothetical protein
MLNENLHFWATVTRNECFFKRGLPIKQTHDMDVQKTILKLAAGSLLKLKFCRRLVTFERC